MADADCHTGTGTDEAGPWPVAIVDDHPVVRSGLGAILAEDARFDVVAAVAHPSALGPLTHVRLVVCDLYLDGERPALAEIAELAAAGARVLVVSASRRRGDVLASLRAGARGYLTKHAEPDQLRDCAVEVARGGLALSSQLADLLSADLTDPALPEAVQPTTPLSPRELETLDWIAQGFTHGQTARRMGVSPSTVDTYIQRIRRKIGAGNKAQLTAAAIALGRLAPAPPTP